MEANNVAAAINEVRKGYAPHWDANLFRALDDVTRKLTEQLPADCRELFLDQAGVKNHD